MLVLIYKCKLLAFSGLFFEPGAFSSNIGLCYITKEINICPFQHHWDYFSKQARKVFIRPESKVPLLRKINIKILRGKHLPLHITAEDFFFKLCVKYIVHVYCTAIN